MVSAFAAHSTLDRIARILQIDAMNDVYFVAVLRSTNVEYVLRMLRWTWRDTVSVLIHGLETTVRHSLEAVSILA